MPMETAIRETGATVREQITVSISTPMEMSMMESGELI